MFPSSPTLPPPPGVFVSDDQSEVTSPLSISEWLLGFHAEARQVPGCMEGICSEGEILHVPSGWWHLAVNMTSTIAITQNFVPEAHLASVLTFLKEKHDQVSGFRKDVGNPYETFTEKLQGRHLDLLKNTLADMKQMQQTRKRKWDQVVGGEDGKEVIAEGFTFGFANGDDGDIP